MRASFIRLISTVQQRNVDGLGQFDLIDEDMWEAHIDVHGSAVEVSLHTYGTDLILSINLTYPNDKNRWHLSYLGTEHGSLNWIPASAFVDE